MSDASHILISSCVLAILGSLVVIWVVSRSIPVPPGQLLWLRFSAWTALSVLVGAGLIQITNLLLVGSQFLQSSLSNEVELRLVASLLWSTPAVVGLIAAVYRQFVRSAEFVEQGDG